MLNKRADSPDELVRLVRDGDTVLISGFGPAGVPNALIDALLRHSATDLTLVANNVGTGATGIGGLIRARRVRRVICSYPRNVGEDDGVFEHLYKAGQIELELVPQGTLAERLRAGGAGIPAFFTPTGAGTELSDGKETRTFHGRPHVLETAIRGDFALIKAHRGDRWGNLVYRKAARNFGPVMAMAAQHTFAEVDAIVELGALDPETIVTPSIFVSRIVATSPLVSSDAPVLKAAAR